LSPSPSDPEPGPRLTHSFRELVSVAFIEAIEIGLDGGFDAGPIF
jgi:hypothetical protein